MTSILSKTPSDPHATDGRPRAHSLNEPDLGPGDEDDMEDEYDDEFDDDDDDDEFDDDDWEDDSDDELGELEDE